MSASARRTMKVLGIVVALLLVAVAAVYTVGQMLRQEKEWTHELSGPVTTLVLDNNVGDVTIRAAADGTAPGITEDRAWSYREPQSTVRQENGVVTVSTSCETFLMVAPCGSDWDIVIPADASVQVTNGVGGIEVIGIAGGTEVRADVGDVTVLESAAGTIVARADVGEVRSESSTPPESVDARAGTGDVTISVPDDGTAYRVEASVGVGEVHHDEVPHSSEAASRLQARSDVGEVRLVRD